MNDQRDIIIIGAGLIGLCTADALEARGARVHVIEARSGPCEGTSFSNSGMIHPSQAMSWEPQTTVSAAQSNARLDAARVTARLAERSQDILMQKIKVLGLPPRPAGCLQLHPNLEGAKAAQNGYHKLGIKTEVLTDTFGMTACHFPNDTSGNARVFGCTLAETLAARGVLFTYEALDVDIRKHRSRFFVSTSKGDFQSDHLVVAAGASSPECLAQLGLRLELRAVSGAAADFALPDDKTDLPLCPIMDAQSRSALTVFESHIRISGGWHLTDPASLVARWREIAPELMQSLGAPRSSWTGRRPISPIGRPFISGTSIPNLWVNTGHGHMGWTLCAGSGELLADLLIGGAEDRRFDFAG